MLLACLIYLHQHRPFRLRLRSTGSRKSSSNEDVDSVLLPLEDDDQAFEPKEKIHQSIILFTVLYSLAALIWNRVVCAYEQLLDSPVPGNAQKQVRPLALRSAVRSMLLGDPTESSAHAADHLDFLCVAIHQCVEHSRLSSGRDLLRSTLGQFVAIRPTYDESLSFRNSSRKSPALSLGFSSSSRYFSLFYTFK